MIFYGKESKKGKEIARKIEKTLLKSSSDRFGFDTYGLVAHFVSNKSLPRKILQEDGRVS